MKNNKVVIPRNWIRAYPGILKIRRNIIRFSKMILLVKFEVTPRNTFDDVRMWLSSHSIL